MAYIGNGRTLMIFGSNVRDDLIPDGIKTEFILSQEVPGGYEGNVWVLRKKYVENEESFWEVLEPEVDYTISGTGDNYNKKINLTVSPAINDKVYVIHKGDATYNFVPSPKSVGPEQLSENLRDFKTENFIGNGSTTTYSLTRDVSNLNSLLVTINGVVKSSDDYSISVDGKDIIFTTAPSNNSKIRILHLSFSTISRRANFVPGQEPAVIENNSIFTDAIQTDAVTKDKIADDSIDGDRILLNNDQSIRSKKSDGTITNILKISTDNNTTLIAPEKLDIVIGNTKKITIDSNSIIPETNNQISIGSSDKKFKDINGVDISALKTLVDQIKSDIDNGTLGVNIMPIGTILIHSSISLPSDKFLICSGQSILKNDYLDLWNVIGYSFGGSGNTFNLPDLRNRVPVGSVSDIGNTENLSLQNRSLTHSHIAPSHSHTIPTHTHTIPGHYHNYELGSDLNITSSGTHTTSIDISHNHTGSVNNNSTGILVNSTSLSLTDPGHAHGGTTTVNPTSLAHTHSNTLTINNNTTLQFYIRASEELNSESGLARFSEATALSANGTGTANRVKKTSIEDHNHSGSVSIDNSGNLNHTHPIPLGTTGITIADHGHNTTDPTHNHLLTINQLSSTRNDTSGIHIHPASSFSGRIGKVTNGSNGNSDLTTSPSPAGTTGTSGDTNTTNHTIPHMSINFIIKAKK